MIYISFLESTLNNDLFETNHKFNLRDASKGSEKNHAYMIFNLLLSEAIKFRASDIHIEPFENSIIIRMRIDGELVKVRNIKLNEYHSLIALIKLNAKMNIAERRLPQDGRFDFKVESRIIDVRVSTIPTINGEKVAVRILDRSTFFKSKSELGFSENAIKVINNMIKNKSGLILVTGPTGSGKTTTVYSLINDLKSLNRNITTIEDPIEYKMDGINQIQVNEKIGLSFNRGMRAVLRQDPDIIVLGEIRDIKTAQTAIRAAITGHLVISTIHTNDAISSILSLMEMGIQTHLIKASLIGVLSQKLVRTLCPNCSHDITIKESLSENSNYEVAIGCNNCNNTGYIGRTAVYEVLELNEEVRSCLLERFSKEKIKNVSIKNGMITFEESIKQLLENKITTLEECTMIDELF